MRGRYVSRLMLCFASSRRTTKPSRKLRPRLSKTSLRPRSRLSLNTSTQKRKNERRPKPKRKLIKKPRKPPRLPRSRRRKKLKRGRRTYSS